MNTSADNELNARLIDLSRAVSSMLDTAKTPDDIAALRTEMLRAVSESSEAARERIRRSSSEN